MTQPELGDQRLWWHVPWVSHFSFVIRAPWHSQTQFPLGSIPDRPFSLEDTVTLGLTLPKPDHRRTCSRIEKQRQMSPRLAGLAGRPCPASCRPQRRDPAARLVTVTRMREHLLARAAVHERPALGLGRH